LPAEELTTMKATTQQPRPAAEEKKRQDISILPLLFVFAEAP